MSSRDLQAWSPTIRVGMPLVRGELLQRGLATGLPLLFSANAFAKFDYQRNFAGFNIDAAGELPDSLDAALDSAGFTASVQFGDYRWSPEQYLELVELRPWAWAACPDYCVEPQVAGNAAVRRLRIDATIATYFRTLDAAARRRIQVPLVGVVQGWYADEYARCAEEMLAGQAPAMVGVGSVCRRHLHGPDGVLAIVQALDQVLPAGTQLHLFGVKSGALAALAPYSHRIASVDSMAWDMAVRREMPTGRTQSVRAQAMADWHARQTQQLHEVVRLPPLEGGPRRRVVEPRAPAADQIALEAAGKVLGDLVLDGELPYSHARHLAADDAALVDAVLRIYGVEAFAEEEPHDDFGLGSLYTDIRDELIAAGHLAPETPAAPRG